MVFQTSTYSDPTFDFVFTICWLAFAIALTSYCTYLSRRNPAKKKTNEYPHETPDLTAELRI